MPTEPDAVAAPTGKSRASLAKDIWAQYRRVLKSLIGLAVVVAVGWIPVRALLETSSTEAVINARLITLRAPIEGQVGPLAAVAAGSEVQPGAALISVVNPRAERGRLDDLRRLVDELESDIKTLIARRADLAALHKDLADQTRAFRAARFDQLEARIAELGSETAAAEAKREEAQQALARARSLDEAGSGTKVISRKSPARCDGCRADLAGARPSPDRSRCRACSPAKRHLRRRQLQRPPAVAAACRRHRAAAERARRGHRPSPSPPRPSAHRAGRREQRAMPSARRPTWPRPCGAASGRS